jgi:hypothetical protein
VRERIDEILADVAKLTTAPRPPAAPGPSRLDQLVAEAEAQVARPRLGPAVVDPLEVAPPATPSAVDAATPVQAEPPASTPPLPADGLPIGMLRPFNPPIRPAPPATGEPGPAEPVRDGPVVPRVPAGPIKYRGALPYFMGNWA